jgi:DNA-binding NarL/FixJ family response regulator
MDLTPRQTQVARLVLRGWTDKEIAAELKISTQRVEQILKAIKRRLGGKGRPRRCILEHYLDAA